MKCEMCVVLLEALESIIAECPQPKLPYGNAVVTIAQKAIDAYKKEV